MAGWRGMFHVERWRFTEAGRDATAPKILQKLSKTPCFTWNMIATQSSGATTTPLSVPATPPRSPSTFHVEHPSSTFPSKP